MTLKHIWSNQKLITIPNTILFLKQKLFLLFKLYEKEGCRTPRKANIG